MSSPVFREKQLESLVGKATDKETIMKLENTEIMTPGLQLYMN